MWEGDSECSAYIHLSHLYLLFPDLLVAIIPITYVTTELVDKVFNSKLAMHGRVAELRCLWATCMEGTEENETKPFCLISTLQTVLN